MGHSFGANTLAKYLAVYKDENPFIGAAVASNPWDFYLTDKFINKMAAKYILKNR